MLRLVMPLTTLALPLPLRLWFPEVMVEEQQVDGCVEEDNDLDDVDKNDDNEMLFGDFDTESKEGLLFVVVVEEGALVLGGCGGDWNWNSSDTPFIPKENSPDELSKLLFDPIRKEPLVGGVLTL